MNSHRITRIAMMLCLLIICSYISIPIGPVPISLQTLAVLLIGLLLPPKEAALTTTLYLVIGLLGLPVFANGGASFQAMLSPSFGFVIGFIPAATIISLIINDQRTSTPRLTIATAIGTIILYIIGLLYMAFILTTYLNLPQTLTSVLSIGLIPFIPGDILKIILAVTMVTKLLPAKFTHKKSSKV